MLQKVLGLCLGFAGLVMCIFVPGAVAANGDVSCSGIAPTVVQHDLIVPAGGSCTILYGSTIKHDVIVSAGAWLDDRGASIGHDITANHPLGVHVNGGGHMGPGTVGHDVVINGATGKPGAFRFNSVCNNIVGHDVVIENSASTAAEWSIGDRNGVCGAGAMTVGHDMQILNNENRLQVEDNSAAFNGGIGHDLVMTGNTGGLIAEANHARNDCMQSGNSPYKSRDGDHNGLNTAGHSVDGCNTPNP